MKLIIETALLSRALYRVQGVIDKKGANPLLSHVLISATEPNEVVFTATDNDVALVAKYAATVTSSGSVAVSARQFYDVVKAIPGATIEIERLQNNWIDVRSGPANFRLVGAAADAFPTPTSMPHTSSFVLPASALNTLIDRTLFCVSSDENRHNLGGVYCETPRAGVLRLVATDGHRLALAEHALTDKNPLSKGVLVPRKGFQELTRVLADVAPDENVRMGFTGSHGFFQIGSAELTTSLIEAQFPDYQQVIPSSSTKHIKLGRVQLSEALKRVALLALGQGHPVRFEFEPGKLKLVAQDPEHGDAHETLDIEYKGEPLTIAFNSRYVLDAVSLIVEQGIVFDLSDPLSPAIIHPLEDTSFLAVVMPVRI